MIYFESYLKQAGTCNPCTFINWVYHVGFFSACSFMSFTLFSYNYLCQTYPLSRRVGVHFTFILVFKHNNIGSLFNHISKFSTLCNVYIINLMYYLYAQSLVESERERADECERKFTEALESSEIKRQKLEETEKRVLQLQDALNR